MQIAAWRVAEALHAQGGVIDRLRLRFYRINCRSSERSNWSVPPKVLLEFAAQARDCSGRAYQHQ